MTPEERERFKEAEKEHLRALKKLKEAARLARRQQSVNQALSDMVGGGGSDDPVGTYEEMLDKLALDTARQEARLEIALENAALKEAETAEPPAPSPEELEEEMIKARARTLLEQMKLQMGMTTPDADAPAQRTASKTSPETEAKPTPSPDRPEKTIGRMK